MKYLRKRTVITGTVTVIVGLALIVATLPSVAQSPPTVAWVHIDGVLGNDTNGNQASMRLDLRSDGHSISYGYMTGVESPGIVSVEVMHHDAAGVLTYDEATATWRHESPGGPDNARIMVTAFAEDGTRFFEPGLPGITEVTRDASGDCILSMAIDTSGTAIETELGVASLQITDRVIAGHCITRP